MNEIEEVKTKVPELVKVVNELTIKDDVSNGQASILLSTIREMEKNVKNYILAEPKKAKDAASKALKDLTDKFYKPLEECEGMIRLKMNQFIMIENARREKLEADLREKQAKEQKKLEKENKKSGNIMPVFVPPPVVIQKVTVANATYRDNWSAEVVDMMELLKAIVGRAAPLDCIIPNEIYLNGIARATKKECDLFIGVKCVNNRSVVSR